MYDRIVAALMDQVTAALETHECSSVLSVQVRIGELCGVDIPSLSAAYETGRRASVCQRAQLKIRPVLASWHCSRCGRTLERGAALQCPECWAPGRLTCGDELVLDSIELPSTPSLAENDGNGGALIRLCTPVLSDAERHAHHNRETFARHGVLALSVIGSEGSGKTSLLEATAARLGRRTRLAAITSGASAAADEARLQAAALASAALPDTTTCPLDANAVRLALHPFPLPSPDILFFEQTGPVVCPTLSDLGQSLNVIVVPVTEGHRDLLAHAAMFQNADLVVLSKIDLLEQSGLQVDAFCGALAHVMPEPRMLALSVFSGEGLADFSEWLLQQSSASRAQHAPAHRFEVHPAARAPRPNPAE